jgi:hypothetical protein
MAETAEQQGIHVVLATLLPTGEYHPDKPGSGLVTGRDEIISGHDKIQTLNNWLKNSRIKNTTGWLTITPPWLTTAATTKKGSAPTASIPPPRLRTHRTHAPRSHPINNPQRQMSHAEEAGGHPTAVIPLQSRTHLLDPEG